MPSSDINAVARQSGVSKATVSRVFTGRAKVSDAVRLKVLEAAAALNYRPQQTVIRNSVAIISDSFRPGGFYSTLVAFLLDALNRRGCQVQIAPLAELDSLLNGSVRIALLLESEDQIREHQELLKKLPFPLVTVNHETEIAHAVYSDHAGGVEQAVAYLVKHGHRRIGLILDQNRNWAGGERRRGYEQALIKYRLKPLPVVTYREKGGMTAALSEALTEHPGALIVCGESLPPETMFALNQTGLKIPADLSLITSEVYSFSRWATPPLTTIHQDLDALCTELLNLMEELLVRPPRVRQIRTLSETLIERDSVRK